MVITNMSSEELSRLELMSRGKADIVFEVGSLVFILTVAIFGNLSVFWVIYRTPNLRNIFGIYIFSLALSDILMASLIMPISVVILVTSRQSFSDWICGFQGFFILVLAWSSLHIMALMAVNRYFRVVRKSLYSRFFTKRSCFMMILGVFVLAGVFVLFPILTGFAKFEFWSARASCFMTLNTSYPSFRRICIAFYLVIYTILPMTTIGFCYYKVHKIVSSHRTAVFPNLGAAFHASSISIEEIRVTKTIFAVVFGFILCWIPSIIVEMLNSINGSRSLPRWSYMLYIYLAYVSCAINPIIYGITNKTFRKVLRKSFGCLSRKGDSVTHTQTMNEGTDHQAMTCTNERNVNRPLTIHVRTFADQT